MSDWTDLIDGLCDYLAFKRECGVRKFELEPGCLPVVPRPGAARSQAGATAPPVVGGGLSVDPTLAALPAFNLAPGDTAAARADELARIAATLAACNRCVLCQQRSRTVPGQGHPLNPDILFVGEAPGADEDLQGLAFVGAAGQLLTRMITAMGYTREQVFIANICKCRPPANRTPAPDELLACLPYLKAQIAIIQPRVIVALGAVAARGLLDAHTGISRLRGKWTQYLGVPLMPTYHPAYLLRFPVAKHDAWDDLKKVLQRLGRPVPESRPAAKPTPP